MKNLKKTNKELVTSNDVSSEIEKKSQALTFDLKDTGIAYRVLQAPLISEKSTFLESNNQYVFKIGIDATRAMVKRAIENVYGIRPIKVNIISMDGKRVRFRGKYGKRKDWKKAIVMLPKGVKISMLDGV